MNLYSHHPIGIYILGEYGISLHQIKFLLDEGYTLADFEENTELAQQLSRKKNLLYNKIKNALPIDSSLFNDSVYKLVAADLSLKNIELLKRHNISYKDIKDLTYPSFVDILQSTTSKEAVYHRIKNAFEKVEESIEAFPTDANKKLYNALLTQLFDSLPPRNFISLFEIKRYLLRKLHINAKEIDENLIKEILEKKLEKDLISSDGLMFAKKYIKITCYLKENNFKDKDILVSKLNNATLQDIADEYGVSRERIRQRLRKTLNNLPITEECLIYQKTFEQYDWNEELFNLVFKEHPYVYRFLKLKFKKGNKDILNCLDDIPFKPEERNLVIKYFNHYVNYENQIVPYSNKLALFEHLVFNFGEVAVQPDEFIEIANEYVTNKEFSEYLMFDKNSINGLADRSNRVIRTNRYGFRYYNLNNLETHEINHLKQLLNLEPGIYSTAKLFKENIELMNELNIHSEHELHNIYKKIIVVPGVEYTRMPEFSVGDVSKEEFMTLLFNELAPILVDDFVTYVEKEYGLKSSSMRALIYSDYIKYLHGNMIVVHHTQVTKEELNLLKNLLNRNLYTLDELTKLGESVDKDFRNKFINNHTLLQVGYYIRGMFILNKKYSSIEQYFLEHILEQDIFHNTRLPAYQTSSFTATLYELEKSLDAIRIDRDLYITSKRLNASGLRKEKLVEYRDAVFAFAAQMEYFTLPQIRLAGFNHPLEEYSFNDTFYERIIWSHPEIRSIHMASHIIFNTSSSEANFTSFIHYIMSKSIQMDLYTFIQKIYREYKINLNPHKLVEIVNNSSMYYSAEMERIYLNKDAFYKDIY